METSAEAYSSCFWNFQSDLPEVEKEDVIQIIKTHDIPIETLVSMKSKAVVFTTLRDPREIFQSYKRISSTEWTREAIANQILKITETLIQASSSGVKLLCTKYSRITHPIGSLLEIRKMAKYLDVRLTWQQTSAISRDLSANNVRAKYIAPLGENANFESFDEDTHYHGDHLKKSNHLYQTLELSEVERRIQANYKRLLKISF